MLATMRRLHPRGCASRGVAVDIDGAMLGPDCELVRRTPAGYRTIAPHEAAAIQKAVLTPKCEPGWLFDQACRIADALASGEIALAQIYGLYIPVSDLDDSTVHRLATTARLVKANFDPGQPRIPVGNPDGGWVDTGGSDATSTADNAGWDGDGDDEGWPTEADDDEFDIDDEFDTGEYDTGEYDLDDGFEGPSRKNPPPPDGGGDEPPRVPSEPPETTPERNSIARGIAEWLRRADVLGLTEATLTFWEIIRITTWLTAEQLAAIISYQDGPWTLEELQDAVARSRAGYERHHIVEHQRQSKNELSNWKRFGSRLNTRENLVLIPSWKHVQISTWYSSRNADYNGLPPREYLRGKSWEEQYGVGIELLRRVGVLK